MTGAFVVVLVLIGIDLYRRRNRGEVISTALWTVFFTWLGVCVVSASIR